MAQAEFVAALQVIADRAKQLDPVMGRILAGVPVKQAANYYPTAAFKELDTIMSRGNQYTKSTTWQGSAADAELRGMIEQLRGGVYGGPVAAAGVAGMSPLMMVGLAAAAFYAYQNRGKIKRALRG